MNGGSRGEKEKKGGISLGLTREEKDLLHDLARDAILIELKGLKRKKEVPNLPPNSILREERGIFVTLKKKGMLRGCIGRISSDIPLYQLVTEIARASAFEDPRFSPLGPQELDDIEIEISVLTPFEQIKDTNEIEVGRDGIFVRKGFHSGLLLPQVAIEWDWDKKRFLEETCNKAGLPKNAWMDKDIDIYIFSAEIF